MGEAVVIVENVTKVYKLYDKSSDRIKESFSFVRRIKYHNEHYALNDVSFQVRKGEILGIVGKNGSGKSTILKIISNVLQPSSGNTHVNGRISALLELGAGFNPEYTGLENIYFNGLILGFEKIEIDSKLDSILKFADIGDFINQPVKTYSSGMFARLAFAVAINIEPEILIVDEALSVGDIFFQNKCFRKFEELKEKGITIIFVSHDMASIKQLCNRVLWLESGKVKMLDSVDKVCVEYSNLLIEELNKNRFDSTKVLSDSQGRTKAERSEEVLVKRFPLLTENNIVSGTRKAQIKSFFITNENEEIVNELSIDTHYNVNMVVEFFELVENALFGFTLESRKGVVLISVNNFILGKSLQFAKSDKLYHVVFSFKLPKIQDGVYLVSPAVASGTQECHQIIAWNHNSLSVQINNDRYNLALLELDCKFNVTEYSNENTIFYK